MSVNLGRALIRMGKIMEDLEPADRMDAARSIYRLYGGPMTTAQRSAHYRQRRHDAVTDPVTLAVTEAVTDPLSFPSSSPSNTQETTGATTGPKSEHRDAARRILAFLNEKSGRSYRPVPVNLDLIVARLKDGATEANCRGIIARKVREWTGDPVMAKYLRPETLFNRTKFESYLGERPPEVTT